MDVGNQISAIDIMHEGLLVGTNSGKYAYYNLSDKQEWVLMGTQMLEKPEPIRKIIALETCGDSFVFISGNILYGVSELDLIPRPGLVMHEIVWATLDSSSKNPKGLVAFTSSTISLLEYETNSFEIRKTLGYGGVVTAYQSGQRILIATKESFELIDIENEAKIQLYAISPNVPPIAGVVNAEEFIIVQGTSVNEPAMGLIIDHQGEISREGEVIVWEKYPSSIAVEDQFVLAVVGDKLVVHDLNNISKTYKTGPDNSCKSVKFVQNTSSAIGVLNNDLQLRIGDPRLSKVYSKTLIVNTDGSVELWTPQPRILRAEKLIDEGKMMELTPDINLIGTEEGVVELEYLTLYLALHFLLIKDYRNARTAWLDGVQINPQVVMYMFDSSGEKQIRPFIFPGVVAHVEQIHERKKSQQDKEFYKTYLESQIKRYQSSQNSELLQQMEIVYSEFLAGRELAEFVASPTTKAAQIILERLKQSNEFEVLEEVFELSGRESNMLSLWTDVLDGSFSEADSIQVENAANKMTSYLLACTNPDLVWKYGLILVSLRPNLGVRVFVEGQCCDKFPEEKVLSALKDVDGDVAWRKYLKHLVYTLQRPIFVADLATLVVNDLIDAVTNPATASLLRITYNRYRANPWPKQGIYRYLQRISEQKQYDSRLLKLQLEFRTLLMRPQTDVTSLAGILDEHTPELYLERCMIYSRLGFHEQCLGILVNKLQDFESLMYYCRFGCPAPPDHYEDEAVEPTQDELDTDIQRDLAQRAFQMMKDVDNPFLLQIASDFIKSQVLFLDLEFLMHHMPEHWPISFFKESILSGTRKLIKKVNSSIFLRLFSRANSIQISSELEAIGTSIV